MSINILQDFVLVLFVVASFLIILKERKTKLGITVKEGDKVLTSGKQGIVTTIGRALSSDVHLKDKSVSRLQASVMYNAKTDGYDLIDYGKCKGNCTSGYYVANHQLKFFILPEEKCFMYGYVIEAIALVFIALQAMSSISVWHDIKAAIPHFILMAFLVVMYFVRADRQPLTESIFVILLTFYIDAVMYPAISNADKYEDCINSAMLGIAIYIAFNIFMKIFLSINMDKSRIHGFLRLLSAAAILILIALNIILAKNVNGAYNWINIGGISLQPSEIIKVLLAFVLVVPLGSKFYSVRNLILEIGLPIVCFFYALVIKDVGVLLQFGVIFVVAILIQNTNILYSLLMIVSGVFGCMLVLKVSTTAAYRFESWLGADNTLFESLTAKEIFAQPYDYGYQSVHSLIAAFKNGGLFGNVKFDVMENIMASNSDLVMSIVGQRHGYLAIYLILALYVILLLNFIFNLKQQNKTQQMYAVLAVTLITFTMALNLCGTFGIVALTGIVNPCLSDGMSSAISYGCLFGVISSTAMSKKYLTKVKEGNLS